MGGKKNLESKLQLFDIRTARQEISSRWFTDRFLEQLKTKDWQYIDDHNHLSVAQKGNVRLAYLLLCTKFGYINFFIAGKL